MTKSYPVGQAKDIEAALSPGNGPMGHLHLFAVDGAAMSMRVQLFCEPLLRFSGFVPRRGYLGHQVTPCLAF